MEIPKTLRAERPDGENSRKKPFELPRISNTVKSLLVKLFE